MSAGKKRPRGETAGKIALALVWAGILAACAVFCGEAGVEEIVRYTPRRPALAAAVMLALFALKSVSVVIYAGILFAACGALFPLPAAIALDLCGVVIMVSIPYALGRKLAGSAVDSVVRRWPKAQALRRLRGDNDFFFAYLARMVGHLPSDVTSLYMGAIRMDYKTYLAGSFLGMLPHTVLFAILGSSISDVRSPAFLLSACIELGLLAGSAVGYRIYRKKHH